MKWPCHERIQLCNSKYEHCLLYDVKKQLGGVGSEMEVGVEREEWGGTDVKSNSVRFDMKHGFEVC